MGQALERDWKQQKNEKEIIWHDAYQDKSKMGAQSVCLNGEKESFRNYEIEKIPGRSACAGCPTTNVSFCGSEKRYWVSICGGDPAFTCRWTGPFEFVPQQDLIYSKIISILNRHDHKVLRKLNSKNIKDLEFLQQFGFPEDVRPEASKEAITKDEAIRIAEQFIKDQGYTDVPTTLSKDQIVFESLEWTSDVNEILKMRRESLKPKAMEAIINESQWLVTFEYAKASTDSSSGRAVKMSLAGKKIRVMHEDLDLSFIRKKAAATQN